MNKRHSASKIIFSTLGAIPNIQKSKMKIDQTDVVLMDEARLALDTSVVPIFFNTQCRFIFMIGDEDQLSPTTRYPEWSNYARSLFERLKRNGYPSDQLGIQYRMHSDIAAFANLVTYKGRLSDYDGFDTERGLRMVPEDLFNTSLDKAKRLQIIDVSGALEETEGDGG